MRSERPVSPGPRDQAFTNSAVVIFGISTTFTSTRRSNLPLNDLTIRMVSGMVPSRSCTRDWERQESNPLAEAVQ